MNDSAQFRGKIILFRVNKELKLNASKLSSVTFSMTSDKFIIPWSLYSISSCKMRITGHTSSETMKIKSDLISKTPYQLPDH